MKPAASQPDFHEAPKEKGNSCRGPAGVKKLRNGGDQLRRRKRLGEKNAVRDAIGDGRGCGPQIIISNTRGTGPNPGPPVPAAATLEAANGMTSHSKTCYADIVNCLARRWPRDAEFSNASGDFVNAHDGRRSIHNRPARPPPEILAPCWIKPKRQSTSGAVRGREASLAA
jgi:hypothetical protein